LNTHLKLYVFKVLSKSKVIKALKVLRRRKHVILCFHRVRPDSQLRDFFDSCPSVTVSMFLEIMNYVSGHYKFVSLRELCNNRNSKRPLVAITFDDGWKDNYDMAFPILRELAIPVTIFVTTGKIGCNKPFWQQILGKQFHTATDKRNPQQEKELKLVLGVNNSQRLNHELYKRIVSELKRLETSVLENKLAAILSGPEVSSETRYFLNEEEIREMSCFGIDFGSHTVSHPILTVESSEKAEIEFEQSKKALEKITGSGTDMVSYPNGAHTSNIVGLARRLGYNIGCTTEACCVGPKHDLLRLPRLDLDWDQMRDENGKFNSHVFEWKAQ